LRDLQEVGFLVKVQNYCTANSPSRRSNGFEVNDSMFWDDTFVDLEQ
jgi:hypothetical protein